MKDKERSKQSLMNNLLWLAPRCLCAQEASHWPGKGGCNLMLRLWSKSLSFRFPSERSSVFERDNPYLLIISKWTFLTTPRVPIITIMIVRRMLEGRIVGLSKSDPLGHKHGMSNICILKSQLSRPPFSRTLLLLGSAIPLRRGILKKRIYYQIFLSALINNVHYLLRCVVSESCADCRIHHSKKRIPEYVFNCNLENHPRVL